MTTTRDGLTALAALLLVMSLSAEPRQTNAEKLMSGSDCSSCHSTDRKVVGPAYRDIAKKYATQGDASEKLARSIRQGGSGNWGSVAMTPHADLKDDQLSEIVAWILSLKAADAATPETTAKQYKYTLADGKTVTLDFPIFIEGDSKKVSKDIFHGYQLYNSYCYRCHGTDATNSELAPDLRRFTEPDTNRQDFLTVAMTGREDKGMPSWAGFLTEEDVQQIYKYVKGRSLGLVPSGRPSSEFD
jgi:cytochrome c